MMKSLQRHLARSEDRIARLRNRISEEESELMEALESAGCPVVCLNSTDHDMALPSGDYYIVSERSVEGLEFHACKFGVEVRLPGSEEPIPAKRWDPTAILVSVESSLIKRVKNDWF